MVDLERHHLVGRRLVQLAAPAGAEDDVAVDEPEVDGKDGGHGADRHGDAAQACRGQQFQALFGGEDFEPFAVGKHHRTHLGATGSPPPRGEVPRSPAVGTCSGAGRPGSERLQAGSFGSRHQHGDTERRHRTATQNGDTEQHDRGRRRDRAGREGGRSRSRHGPRGRGGRRAPGRDRPRGGGPRSPAVGTCSGAGRPGSERLQAGSFGSRHQHGDTTPQNGDTERRHRAARPREAT